MQGVRLPFHVVSDAAFEAALFHVLAMQGVRLPFHTKFLKWLHSNLRLMELWLPKPGKMWGTF